MNETCTLIASFGISSSSWQIPKNYTTNVSNGSKRLTQILGQFDTNETSIVNPTFVGPLCPVHPTNTPIPATSMLCSTPCFLCISWRFILENAQGNVEVLSILEILGIIYVEQWPKTKEFHYSFAAKTKFWDLPLPTLGVFQKKSWWKFPGTTMGPPVTVELRFRNSALTNYCFPKYMFPTRSKYLKHNRFLSKSDQWAAKVWGYLDISRLLILSLQVGAPARHTFWKNRSRSLINDSCATGTPFTTYCSLHAPQKLIKHVWISWRDRHGLAYLSWQGFIFVSKSMVVTTEFEKHMGLWLDHHHFPY